jgi:hypothetical protein
MARDTADLIRRLAAAGTPVRPLSRPWMRTAMWCAVSLPYLWLLSLVWPHADTAVLTDRRFIIEQAAALATGLTAAAAAFATLVPGASRRIVLAPIVPLALWMGNLERLCAGDWSASGHLPAILIHWACFPATCRRPRPCRRDCRHAAARCADDAATDHRARGARRGGPRELRHPLRAPVRRELCGARVACRRGLRPVCRRGLVRRSRLQLAEGDRGIRRWRLVLPSV